MGLHGVYVVKEVASLIKLSQLVGVVRTSMRIQALQRSSKKTACINWNYYLFDICSVFRKR